MLGTKLMLRLIRLLIDRHIWYKEKADDILITLAECVSMCVWGGGTNNKCLDAVGAILTI